MMQPPPMPDPQPPPFPEGKVVGGVGRMEPSKVRIWIAINLGAFPGLGTILARRKEGYAQAIWMVVGFVLFVMGVYRWARYQVDMVVGNGRALEGPGLGMVWWGLAIVVSAWAWSGWSSWQMWQEATSVAGPSGSK